MTWHQTSRWYEAVRSLIAVATELAECRQTCFPTMQLDNVGRYSGPLFDPRMISTARPEAVRRVGLVAVGHVVTEHLGSYGVCAVRHEWIGVGAGGRRECNRCGDRDRDQPWCTVCQRCLHNCSPACQFVLLD